MRRPCLTRIALFTLGLIATVSLLSSHRSHRSETARGQNRFRSLASGDLANANDGSLSGTKTLGDPTRRELIFQLASIDPAAFESLGYAVRPAINLPKPLLDAMRARAEEYAGRPMTDLSTFFAIDVPEAADASAISAMKERLIAALHPSLCYLQRGYRVAGDILPPATPDLTHARNGESYLDAAPLGVNAAYASTRNFKGQGMNLCDVERSWNLSHEDFMSLAAFPIQPAAQWFNPPTGMASNHGTSSLGILAADDDAPGIIGLAPRSTVVLAPTELRTPTGALDPSFTARNAIVLATLIMAPGSIMLLELQDDFDCFETFPLERAIVDQATALGIHVIEPAGNGGFDLNTMGFDLLAGDSNALIVGASESQVRTTPAPGVQQYHRPMSFSNNGHRVDAYAWGQFVTTTGGGDAFFGGFDHNQRYTHIFQGTSSASAIVAGSATLVAQMFKAQFGQHPTPRQLRNQMSLGTPSLAPIGYMPDLEMQHQLMQKAGVLEHVLRGNFDNRMLGSAVSKVLDMNLDGVADIAVGDPSYDPGSAQDTGRVIIYSGRNGDVLRILVGANAGDRFGAALSSAGDVDADGFGDLVVGIPGADFSFIQDSGEVQVFSGLTGGVIFDEGGSNFNEQFGTSVAGARNLMDVVIVGVPGANNDDGEVRMYATMSSPPRIPLFTWSGTAQGTGGRFGHCVSTMPDLNNDTIPEVLVGAPMLAVSPTAVDQGGAFVFSGFPFGPTAGRLIQRFLGEIGPVCRYAKLGWSLASAGDVDRDGTPDLVIGSPGYSNEPGGPTYRGRVYIVSGRTWQTLYTQTGVHTRSNLGWSVAGVGDYDGDGFNDVAVGEPSAQNSLYWPHPAGRAYIISGPFGIAPASDKDQSGAVPVLPAPVYPQPPQTIQPAPPSNNKMHELWQKDLDGLMGSCVASVGDINGDGRPDVIVGAPGHSRAYVMANRPGRYPFMKFVGFAANEAAQEVFDRDNNGFAGGTVGGSTSPESCNIQTFAPGLGGIFFRVSCTTANPSPLAQRVVSTFGRPVGQINGSGLASVQFGRHATVQNPPLNPNDLRTIVGTEFRFTLDLSLDGVTWFSNLATTKVTFVTEF